MSYNTIASSAIDQALHQRIAAAAAQEGVTTDVQMWAHQHIWQVVKAPEIEQAYASALAALRPDPGQDESVITDGMILAQVQPLVLAEQDSAP